MSIQGWYIGASFDVIRFVTGVPTTDAVTKAWLTIKNKSTDADPGILQKVITTTAVAGVGQVVQDGSVASGNGTAQLLFNLTTTDTATLGAASYVYDVQIKLSSGKIFTSDTGAVAAGQARVTAAQT